MPRSVNGTVKAKRKNKIMKRAKGFVGGRRRLYRSVIPTVMRALAYSYRDRRNKKRDFRRLWIARISAAAKINGINYSQLMNKLKKANITLNRKTLSNLAIVDPEAFAKVAELAKSAK